MGLETQSKDVGQRYCEHDTEATTMSKMLTKYALRTYHFLHVQPIVMHPNGVVAAVRAVDVQTCSQRNQTVRKQART